MIVELLQPKDKEKWDEFVNQHSEGRFIHFAAYKDILERTYGYKGHFLYIQDQRGEILSISPFFEFKSLFKKKFVSQPFSEYGGILFNAKLTWEEKKKIIQIWKEYFKKFLSEHKIPYLEIHGQFDEINLFKSHFISKPMGKIAVLKLDSYQDLYNNFDYQVKKAINKAEREGVKVYEETHQESIEKKFYPLYIKYFKKRHGSPPHSLNLFLNYYKFSPQNIRIYFAEINNVLVAALWGFLTKNRVNLAYNPCLEEYFIYRPDDLLHARFIQWACQNNFKYFDFGPARYEGQIKYKRKWGVEFFDYLYLYFSNFPISPIPIVPETKLIELFSWVWKKLLPSPLANKLGPMIRKNLGK